MHFIKAALKLLNAIAIVANGLLIPISLLMGLVWFSADIGVNEARAGLAWSVLIAVAAFVFFVSLVVPKRHHVFMNFSYCIVIVLSVISTCWWVEQFKSSTPNPQPTEAIALGVFALFNWFALVAKREPMTHRHHEKSRSL